MQATLDQIKALPSFQAVVALGYVFTSTKALLSRMNLRFASPNVEAGDGSYQLYSYGTTRFVPTKGGYFGNTAPTKIREVAAFVTLADWDTALQHLARAIVKRRAKLAKAIIDAPKKLAAAQKRAEEDNARQAMERETRVMAATKKPNVLLPQEAYKVTQNGDASEAVLQAAHAPLRLGTELQMSSVGVIEPIDSKIAVSLTMDVNGTSIDDVIRQLQSAVKHLEILKNFGTQLPVEVSSVVGASTAKFRISKK